MEHRRPSTKACPAFDRPRGGPLRPLRGERNRGEHRPTVTALLLSVLLGLAAGLVSSSAGAQTPDPPYPIEKRELQEAPPEKLPRREGEYLVDVQHRRMKVQFSPGNRLRYGSAWEADIDAGNGSMLETAAWQLSIGSEFGGESHFDDEGSWKMRHRVGEFEVRPLQITHAGWPVMDLELYEAEFIRHRNSPHIVIPTIPPRRLFVPFDFGVSLRTGGLHVPRDLRAAPDGGEKSAGAVTSAWDVELIDARLLLEFWRSERFGSALLLGIGTRYDLFVTRSGGDGPSLEHVLSPFTATSLTFRHEWADGRQRAAASVDSHPFWSSRRGLLYALDASARYDITLLAINDQPISLNLRADYRYGEFHPLPEGPAHVVQVMAGLEFGVE